MPERCLAYIHSPASKLQVCGRTPACVVTTLCSSAPWQQIASPCPRQVTGPKQGRSRLLRRPVPPSSARCVSMMPPSCLWVMHNSGHFRRVLSGPPARDLHRKRKWSELCTPGRRRRRGCSGDLHSAVDEPPTRPGSGRVYPRSASLIRSRRLPWHARRSRPCLYRR